jgi:curved DNA-binding protein CbpA
MCSPSKQSIDLSSPSTKAQWAQRLAQIESQNDLERLNLPPECDEKSINKRYKQFSKIYHPDRNIGFEKESEQIFKLLNASKDRLLVEVADRILHSNRSHPAPQDGGSDFRREAEARARSAYDILNSKLNAFQANSERAIREAQASCAQQVEQAEKAGSEKLMELNRQKEAQRKAAEDQSRSQEEAQNRMMAQFKDQEAAQNQAVLEKLAKVNKQLQKMSLSRERSIQIKDQKRSLEDEITRKKILLNGNKLTRDQSKRLSYLIDKKQAELEEINKELEIESA